MDGSDSLEFMGGGGGGGGGDWVKYIGIFYQVGYPKQVCSEPDLVSFAILKHES